MDSGVKDANILGFQEILQQVNRWSVQNANPHTGTNHDSQKNKVYLKKKGRDTNDRKGILFRMS